MNDQLIAEYKVIGGNSVLLYENRIEIRRKVLGMALKFENVTIPIKSIARIEGPTISPLRKLTITTIDGATFEPILLYKQQIDFKEKLEKLV